MLLIFLCRKVSFERFTGGGLEVRTALIIRIASVAVFLSTSVAPSFLIRIFSDSNGALQTIDCRPKMAMWLLLLKFPITISALKLITVILCV